MHNVDWAKIKAEYIAGGISQQKLADKYGLPYPTLRKTARIEQWTEKRDEAREKGIQKAIEKTASQYAKNVESIERIRAKLIARIENAVDTFPDVIGTQFERTVTEKVSSESTEGKRAQPKQVTLRTGADIIKLVDALQTLTEMIGIDEASAKQEDDGFIAALDRKSEEVTKDVSDTPDDFQ